MCDHSDDVDELSASDASDPEEQPSGAPFDPELDHDDDDDNIGDAVASVPATQTPFSLRGGNSAFSDRSHSIFDCLDTQLSSSSLKQDHITHGEFVQPRPPHPSRKTSQPPSTSPPPKKRGVPDYLVHPERWTHYSLEDVTETSDQDNRRAAHQFLSSLQQEKRSDSPCHAQQRMVFSRPKQPLKEQTADQASAVKGNEKGMHLSHLEEEEKEVEKASEQEKAGVRRTDQSEGGTEDREREEEEEDSRRKTERPEEDQQKGGQKEKDDDKKVEEVDCGFASFRKTKSKNYRKSSKQEDD